MKKKFLTLPPAAFMPLSLCVCADKSLRQTVVIDSRTAACGVSLSDLSIL